MKLWVFGHSSCLPFNLAPGSLAWPDVICQRLNISIENFAEAAADNLYIYHTFMQARSRISFQDRVIISWSHPNRKSFVLDRSNHRHREALEQGALLFPGPPEFFRSRGRPDDTKDKWSQLLPRALGYQYFDTWFEHYHNEFECRLNLQAYDDSVRCYLPENSVIFYFSRDSHHNASPDSFFWLDWILDSGCQNSDLDMHPNAQGHMRLADIMLEKLSLS